VSDASFTLHAGPRAARWIRERGLSPEHVSCIPAAAGGPKGLALIPLDVQLFGGWLGDAQPERIGASIGAWRMLASAQREPARALHRLADAYVSQTYPAEPPPSLVSAECRKLAQAALGDGLASLQPGAVVRAITARSRGPLAGRRSRAAFARAALANLAHRDRLAAYMERVVFGVGDSRLLSTPFDAFGLTHVTLTDANAEDALLASGSIPLICDPVATPADAPAGEYWDGGLIDYHLRLPYATLDGIVLYPHFAPRVTPGWLDKLLPWRQHRRGDPWLDNVLLIAPSPALLARLPNGKLPDRNDFLRYGADNKARQRDWRRAIAECDRMADEIMAWLDDPQPQIIQPL
jgi:hypothetical protein